nr:MAG TPA: hypothetical protein [Caudoviricetes sp.]
MYFYWFIMSCMCVMKLYIFYIFFNKVARTGTII